MYTGLMRSSNYLPNNSYVIRNLDLRSPVTKITCNFVSPPMCLYLIGRYATSSHSKGMMVNFKAMVSLKGLFMWPSNITNLRRKLLVADLLQKIRPDFPPKTDSLRKKLDACGIIAKCMWSLKTHAASVLAMDAVCHLGLMVPVTPWLIVQCS